MKYSLTKFTENIPEAFQRAEEGQEVLIERYGRTFELKLVRKDYSSYAIKEPVRKRPGAGDTTLADTIYDDEPRVVPVEE